MHLFQGKDFTTDYAFRSIDLSGSLIFAGHGIRSDDPEYNNYKSIDIKGKVVLD
jgi:hypothetical protein